ncbi:hypothetical protein UCRPC4_g06979 [Phaeomoniella chlamydospora]|uniref:Uncharacterized protein n=1 Tax=Phaeomoniella chlamydospora TaxID=158046 RepID=A0A0G2DRI6_PHACM|nr:hypothetical protein UCRPC4_g06979 [Phaeomoniella chlamydospora]
MCSRSLAMNQQTGGIWGSNVSREQLLQKISLCAMLGGAREGLREHSLNTRDGANHQLSVEQEAEIAGNLAFLSRRRKCSQSVAAVAIEEAENGHGLSVRLAVNGDALQHVEAGLRQICSILEQISRDVHATNPAIGAIITGEETEHINILLGEVITICSSRISSRLRLARKHDIISTEIMQLRQSVSNAELEMETKAELNDLVRLYRQLKASSEPSTNEANVVTLAKIIGLAHNLSQSHSFRGAIRSGERKEKLSDTIIKLGQYYRATKQLVLVARRRRYRVFERIEVSSFQISVPPEVRINTDAIAFTDIMNYLPDGSGTLKVLQRYQGSKARICSKLASRLNDSRSGIKVHAEIKLLFFYEIHPNIKRPRVITANKSSCYLCDLFFRLHGTFQVPSTFGMLTERWILPDWCPIPRTQLDHIRKTAIQFDDALSLQISRTLERRPRLPDPMQSLVALSANWSDPQSSEVHAATVSGHISSSISENSRLSSSSLRILKPNDYTIIKLCDQDLSLDFFDNSVLLYYRPKKVTDEDTVTVHAQVNPLSLVIQDKNEEVQRAIFPVGCLRSGTKKVLKCNQEGSSTSIRIHWGNLVVSLEWTYGKD